MICHWAWESIGRKNYVICVISKKQYGQHCVRSVWEDWCPAVLGSVGGAGGGLVGASIIGRRVKLCNTHTDKRALSES